MIRKRGNTTGLYSLAPVAVQGGDFSAIAARIYDPNSHALAADSKTITATSPEMRGGFRIALAAAITLVVVSEFMGASFGLGYLISVSKVTLTIPTILSGDPTTDLFRVRKESTRWIRNPCALGNTIRLAIMLERKRVLLLDVFRILIGPTSIGWR